MLHGDPPHEVYSKLADYVGDLPVCAYNLACDWEQVLLREWKRLDIAPIGTKGFCFLKLAQRLLDPVPSGNCKLQTLRQYYRLPSRNAHSASGDVGTVIDLLRDVLYPLACERNLPTPAHWSAFSRETWFPARITFGKYKSRHYLEALDDTEFTEWLNWLGRSDKGESRKMGKWYIARLDEARQKRDHKGAPSSANGLPIYKTTEEHGQKPSDAQKIRSASASSRQDRTTRLQKEPADDAAFRSITLYTNPQKEKLRLLIEGSLALLAQYEAAYHLDQNTINTFRRTLYHHLRHLYEKEKRLLRLVEYRRQYLDKLTQDGEDSAAEVVEAYRHAALEDEEDFRQTASKISKIRTLSDEEQKEVKTLYRDLMKLYHPDRYMEDETKRQAYENISRLINKAKDENDLDTLRTLANDPDKILSQQGLHLQDYEELHDIISLQRLYESLQVDILAILERHNALRESKDHEVAHAFAENPSVLDTFLARNAATLNAKIQALEAEAKSLAEEIEALTGSPTAIHPPQF